MPRRRQHYLGDHGINSADQVVGVSEIAVGQFLFHAFFWENGVMTDLGTLGGSLGQLQGRCDLLAVALAVLRVVTSADTLREMCGTKPGSE